MRVALELATRAEVHVSGISEIRRLNELEDENRGLKQVVADLTLDKAMLEDVVRRKW